MPLFSWSSRKFGLCSGPGLQNAARCSDCSMCVRRAVSPCPRQSSLDLVGSVAPGQVFTVKVGLC